MKLFTAEQIRALDRYTIEHEPIASIDLMERAAQAFTDWFVQHYPASRPVAIFCGMGNNGGDGLAIARLLQAQRYTVQCFVMKLKAQGSDDFETNLQRLQELTTVTLLERAEQLPVALPDDALLIDALFGSGLDRPVEGFPAQLIQFLNRTKLPTVAVDIASGLFADRPNGSGDVIVKPEATFSFQFPKLAFLLPGNAQYVGEWYVGDIGLHPEVIQQTETSWFYTDAAAARALLQPRTRFSHKGNFGRALLIAGSYGKIGAAVLSAHACLRAGAGLTSALIPQCGYKIMQTALPEVMVMTAGSNKKIVSDFPPLGAYDAIGVGPGLGKDFKTAKALGGLIEKMISPMVIDADAINLTAENQAWLAKLPRQSIFTPHPKEFERLVGPVANDYERLARAKEFAQRYQCVIVLKGAYTAVVLWNGEVHFNTTGNPGMAKGGSGDALTGILTALLAQEYDSATAAKLGVYLHGAAGDLAAQHNGMIAMTATDLIEQLGHAFEQLNHA
ncbi:NAD(P)H-hydrate epimerase [Catalinimonas alkaloidigena]|uniref:Bifunctional NAD(P)H-hydrate repair enzyme n=1 Tax=Catalinimonas alkaloidigena TaxID=1075417 RepID=A0A1G9F443_9BACT|nr:NAD(P)H-hydrate dehydratase [Catalinimonas alkaloidigena]SDK83003.1 NAD(P)H-hydrate epimerase [Catalinimonas alkaloidigena]